ncbi:MAG TPA: hypothetical protein ENN34_02485 [Deltaproteobacteria bacterium]|nr:hypothetical protein [Deltaproteobacteria bacterium]
MPRSSLGHGTMWLFSHPGNSNLIITAHGGKPDPDEKITWPPKDAGAPVIWFCSRHGKSTSTQVEDILKVLSGSKTVLDLIRAMGFHPLLQKEVFNYHLQKYAGSGSDDYETYKDYEGWIKHSGCDILSPRNRWFSSEIRLSTIFDQKTIRTRGYKNVYCSFCRS